jgi:hypothetical protein
MAHDPHLWPEGYILPFKVPTPFADEEPIGYDGFGAPLYAHQIPERGTE